MDPLLARTMVENLSKGINPLTGQVLSSQDVCSCEEVQDALIEVLEHCTIESNEQYLVRIREEKKAAQKVTRENNCIKYPRNGKPWTSTEEQRILRLHRDGYSIYRIAKILERTPQAVLKRLQKLWSTPVHRK